PPDRRTQLRGNLDERGRDTKARRQLAHLGAVARERERPGADNRLLDRPRTGRRVAVLVAADPAPEPKRRRSGGEAAPQVADELRCNVEQTLLQEPEAVPDLVDDAGPLRAHLVRLPERGPLLRDSLHRRLASRARERLVVETVEQAIEAQLRRENRAAGRLGRVRGEDELEGEPSACGGQLPRRHPGALEASEGICQRFVRRALLVLVLAPAAQPMMLLGQVDELEV